jgi:hypothetical protein
MSVRNDAKSERSNSKPERNNPKSERSNPMSDFVATSAGSTVGRLAMSVSALLEPRSSTSRV